MSEQVRAKELGYLNEKQLERRCGELQHKIRSLRRSSDERQLLEIEFCYTFRELEFRKKRKVAHQNFLAKKYKNRDNRAKGRKNVV